MRQFRNLPLNTRTLLMDLRSDTLADLRPAGFFDRLLYGKSDIGNFTTVIVGIMHPEIVVTGLVRRRENQ